MDVLKYPTVLYQSTTSISESTTKFTFNHTKYYTYISTTNSLTEPQIFMIT